MYVKLETIGQKAPRHFFFFTLTKYPPTAIPIAHILLPNSQTPRHSQRKCCPDLFVLTSVMCCCLLKRLTLSSRPSITRNILHVCSPVQALLSSRSEHAILMFAAPAAMSKMTSFFTHPGIRHCELIFGGACFFWGIWRLPPELKECLSTAILHLLYQVVWDYHQLGINFFLLMYESQTMHAI